MKKTNIRKRILAFFIDYFIYAIIFVIPTILFISYDLFVKVLAGSFFIFFLVFMLTIVIAISLKDIFRGRSIGKRILKLYVRKSDDYEKVPELHRLLTRNLFLIIWPVEFIILLKSKNNRRLGDKLAKTQVVEKDYSIPIKMSEEDHYEFLNNQINTFNIHTDGWYNMWHMHLDWSGLSNKSIEIRQEHIQYYLDLLDNVETQITKNYIFQVWIHIDKDGSNDALFLHTENPNTDFPCKFNNFEWIENLPNYYQSLDEEVYRIGMVSGEYEFYVIQKKELGISL